MLELASDERILVTAGKDFGDLVFRLRQVAFGVLLVRLTGLSSASKADAVSESVREHGREMAGTFTVVSPGLVRIRLGWKSWRIYESRSRKVQILPLARRVAALLDAQGPEVAPLRAGDAHQEPGQAREVG